MDISGERETQMTESLISKVKELINKGNAEEALSLLQSRVEQGDGRTGTSEVGGLLANPQTNPKA